MTDHLYQYESDCELTNKVNLKMELDIPEFTTIKQLMQLESVANIIVAQAAYGSGSSVVNQIRFYMINSSNELVETSVDPIDQGLSANSWIMAYDSLRQALFVASDKEVKVLFIEFYTCFGQQIEQFCTSCSDKNNPSACEGCA